MIMAFIAQREKREAEELRKWAEQTGTINFVEKKFAFCLSHSIRFCFIFKNKKNRNCRLNFAQRANDFAGRRQRKRFVQISGV